MGALGLTWHLAPKAAPNGEVPAPGQRSQTLCSQATLCQRWVFKQHQSSTQIKPFWDFQWCAGGLSLPGALLQAGTPCVRGTW